MRSLSASSLLSHVLYAFFRDGSYSWSQSMYMLAFALTQSYSAPSGMVAWSTTVMVWLQVTSHWNDW